MTPIFSLPPQFKSSFELAFRNDEQRLTPDEPGRAVQVKTGDSGHAVDTDKEQHRPSGGEDPIGKSFAHARRLYQVELDEHCLIHKPLTACDRRNCDRRGSIVLGFNPHIESSACERSKRLPLFD
jgi:hypothetical protein